MKNKNLAPHITALVSAVGGFLALLHPGFDIAPFVQGWSVTVTGFVSCVVEIVHFVKKHNFEAALQVAQSMNSQKS